MSAPIIIAIGVVAFLIVLFVIYFDNIKGFFKSKHDKKEPKAQPKKEKKKEISYEEFKPLKTIDNDKGGRDISLDALFDDYTPLQEYSSEQNGEDIYNKSTSQEQGRATRDSNFDDFFKTFKDDDVVKKEKSLSEQISELPPEIKILLIDNLLNKKDDI